MRIKVFFIVIIGINLIVNNATSQTPICNINPNEVIGTVSGSFVDATETNYGKNAVLVFRGYEIDDLGGRLVKKLSLDLYRHNSVSYNIWNQLSFDYTKIQSRIVSGAFTHGNVSNAISSAAAFYDNGNGTTTIKLWTVYRTNVNYTSNAWTSPTGSTFDATKISGRVVNGDFDNDGYMDDIAALYDYGNSVTKIHVWIGDGFGGFSHYIWWDSTPLGGYSCAYISNRIVAGDFDHDGYIDDIAVMFDYGGGAMRIHVFKSNGNSFAYQGASGWWATSSGYSPSNINGRIVCINFDKSGLINHKNDDIVALYDYGNGNVKAHIWASNGNSFSYYWRWEVSGFYPSNVTGRLNEFQTSASGNPQKCFDMTGLYNYGTLTDRYYIWTNQNDQFSSGLDYLCTKSLNIFSNESDSEGYNNVDDASCLIFPNPNDGNFTLKMNNNEKISKITVENSAGCVILDSESFDSEVNISLPDLSFGIYFVKITDSTGKLQVKKIIIN